jgi:hypothetical protein
MLEQCLSMLLAPVKICFLKTFGDDGKCYLSNSLSFGYNLELKDGGQRKYLHLFKTNLLKKLVLRQNEQTMIYSSFVRSVYIIVLKWIKIKYLSSNTVFLSIVDADVHCMVKPVL